MSRSGYHEDYDDEWRAICYRGAVSAAIRGKRGQALLQALADALDAMPEKKLISSHLKDPTGQFCALGALGERQGLPIDQLDPEDPYAVAKTFNIAPALAREIVWENDEAAPDYEIPEQRWKRMRAWVERSLRRVVSP